MRIRLHSTSSRSTLNLTKFKKHLESRFTDVFNLKFSMLFSTGLIFNLLADTSGDLFGI